jgi:thioesterase domain-containing protein
VRALGLLADEEPLSTLGEMAGQYARLLERHQPHGDFRLLGYSMGGVMAVEVARRLRGLGRAVCFIGVIDNDPPGPPPLSWASPLRLCRFLCNLWGWAANSWKEYGLAGLTRHGWRKLSVMMRAAGGEVADLNAVVDASRLSEKSRQIWSALYRANLEHRMGPYEGPVDVFRASVQPLFGNHDPDLGWSGVASAVRVHEVRGNHATVLQEPHLSQLATAISGALARVG